MEVESDSSNEEQSDEKGLTTTEVMKMCKELERMCLH
jgi:hypothetical protein